MKIIFVGDYQNKFAPAPVKVGKELFSEFRKVNSETFFYSYFQDGRKYSLYKKIFGCEKIDNNNYKFGFLPFLLNVIRINPNIIIAVTPAVYYLPILIIKIILKFKFIYYTHSVNKYVLNQHLELSKKLRFRFLFIEKVSFNFADAIYSLSKKEKKYIGELYKSCEKKITVVDNGLKNFEIKKRDYKINDNLNIICVGGLNRKEKSYPLLLKSLGEINKSFNLTICSNEINRPRIYKHSSNIQLNLINNLSEQELREEISQNDLFLIVSSYESFSLALLEAMNTGIPFIATDVVGLTERFNNKLLNQQVIPSNDSYALQNKIEEFFNMTETERSEIGEKGIEFSNNYTWENVANATYHNIKNIGKYN